MLAVFAGPSLPAVDAEAFARAGLIASLEGADLPERLGAELTADLELVVAGAGWVGGVAGAGSASEPNNQANGLVVQKELAEALDSALA